MREAQLTVGTLLIFVGCMGAIAGSTYNTSANIDKETVVTFFGTLPKLQALLIVEVVSTIIALIGAAMVMRNR